MDERRFIMFFCETFAPLRLCEILIFSRKDAEAQRLIF